MTTPRLAIAETAYLRSRQNGSLQLRFHSPLGAQTGSHATRQLVELKGW